MPAKGLFDLKSKEIRGSEALPVVITIDAFIETTGGGPSSDNVKKVEDSKPPAGDKTGSNIDKHEVFFLNFEKDHLGSGELSGLIDADDQTRAEKTEELKKTVLMCCECHKSLDSVP